MAAYEDARRLYYYRLWKEWGGEQPQPEDPKASPVVFKEPKRASLTVEIPKAPQTFDLDKIRGTD